MQTCASICTHHFFYRAASTGILVRGGLITAIYTRSLRLTTRARSSLPNGRIVNFISTDVSRLDFCCGYFHMVRDSKQPYESLPKVFLVLGRTYSDGSLFGPPLDQSRTFGTGGVRLFRPRDTNTAPSHEIVFLKPEKSYVLDGSKGQALTRTLGRHQNHKILCLGEFFSCSYYGLPEKRIEVRSSMTWS